MNSRERVLGHLEGREVDHLPLMPITMMFAARQIGVKYREYVTDYRVLAEGQIETARKFQFDYVNIMGDPAREAADLGAAIEWFEDQPPAIAEQRARLADKHDLERLQFPNPLAGGRMEIPIRALRLLKERIGTEKILEGWVEGPCAEGADLRGINTLMLDFADDPGFVRDLFEFAVEMELRFGRAQIEAGAEVIGIGDAAASLVGGRIYGEFVFPFERKLVDGLHAMGARVRLHICGNTRKLLPWFSRLGADILDLDSMVPIAEARRHCGAGQVLLGNIDPVRTLREATPKDIVSGLAECHRDAGPRYIVGAGCEVVRDTPEENVRAMVQYARSPAAIS